MLRADDLTPEFRIAIPLLFRQVLTPRSGSVT